MWSDYEKRRRRYDMKNKIIINFASPNKNIKSILEFWKWTARHERVMLRHKHHTRYSSDTSSLPGASAGEKNKSTFFWSQSEKSDMAILVLQNWYVKFWKTQQKNYNEIYFLCY